VCVCTTSMQNPSVSATVYLRTESNYLVPRGDISVYQIMHWMRQQWSHTLEDPKADRTKSNTQAEVSRSKQTNKQTLTARWWGQRNVGSSSLDQRGLYYKWHKAELKKTEETQERHEQTANRDS